MQSTEGRIGLCSARVSYSETVNVQSVRIFVAWPTSISGGEMGMLRQLSSLYLAINFFPTRR